MLSTGVAVIVNSEDTLGQLEDYAKEHNYLLPPNIYSPLAVHALPEPSLKRLIEEPYFVIIGTIEGRKNHLLLLNIWRELYQQFGADAPKLVIIGRRGWECEQVS